MFYIKKKRSNEEEKRVMNKLQNKIMELCEDVREEFDILELIQDSVKEIFDCDLDCSTCSTKEQGKCMQNFKVGNLLLLRKLQQDEYIILDFIQNVEDIIHLVKDWKQALDMEKREVENKSKERYKDRFNDVKKKHVERMVDSFYI